MIYWHVFYLAKRQKNRDRERDRERVKKMQKKKWKKKGILQGRHLYIYMMFQEKESYICLHIYIERKLFIVSYRFSQVRDHGTDLELSNNPFWRRRLEILGLDSALCHGKFSGSTNYGHFICVIYLSKNLQG